MRHAFILALLITMNPAIVIPAFHRPLALNRLLRSLLRADYSQEGHPVPLVLSLEGGASEEVKDLVRGFTWPHGPLEILERSERLGLKNHILACGDLTERFGSVIVLEDDLLVAPGFYAFAREACAFYETDPRIAGTSLYSFLYNEFGGFPFIPMDDGLDLYFVQSGSSWGQTWTHGQWTRFRGWMESDRVAAIPGDVRIPEAVRAWPDQSWKRLFNAYLVDTNTYIAVPRISKSTNMGDEGTHFPCLQTHFATPLPIRPRKLSLPALDDSLSRYDAYFELEPDCLNRAMETPFPDPFSIDLFGIKPIELLAQRPWTLSCRAQPTRGNSSFGLRLMPPELNACYAIEGEFYTWVPSTHLMPRLPVEKRMALRQFFIEKPPLPSTTLERRARAIAALGNPVRP